MGWGEEVKYHAVQPSHCTVKETGAERHCDLPKLWAELGPDLKSSELLHRGLAQEEAQLVHDSTENFLLTTEGPNSHVLSAWAPRQLSPARSKPLPLHQLPKRRLYGPLGSTHRKALHHCNEK